MAYLLTRIVPEWVSVHGSFRRDQCRLEGCKQSKCIGEVICMIVTACGSSKERPGASFHFDAATHVCQPPVCASLVAMDFSRRRTLFYTQLDYL